MSKAERSLWEVRERRRGKLQWVSQFFAADAQTAGRLATKKLKAQGRIGPFTLNARRVEPDGRFIRVDPFVFFGRLHTPEQRELYVAYCYHAHKTPEVNPGDDYLAHLLGLKDTSALRKRRQSFPEGVIETRRGGFKGMLHTTLHDGIQRGAKRDS